MIPGAQRTVFFTRAQAEGALPNGTRVEKIRSKIDDTHLDGAQAVILGSMGPATFDGETNVYGYFVEWDDVPGVPCFVSGNRVREVKPD